MEFNKIPSGFSTQFDNSQLRILFRIVSETQTESVKNFFKNADIILDNDSYGPSSSTATAVRNLDTT